MGIINGTFILLVVYGCDMGSIEAGDTVQVHIKNDAPIGGDTQFASFEARDVQMHKVTGVDPTWGDTCTIEGFGTDELTYTDGGKSGEVVKYSVVN